MDVSTGKGPRACSVLWLNLLVLLLCKENVSGVGFPVRKRDTESKVALVLPTKVGLNQPGKSPVQAGAQPDQQHHLTSTTMGAADMPHVAETLKA